MGVRASAMLLQAVCLPVLQNIELLSGPVLYSQTLIIVVRWERERMEQGEEVTGWGKDEGPGKRVQHWVGPMTRRDR